MCNNKRMQTLPLKLTVCTTRPHSEALQCSSCDRSAAGGRVKAALALGLMLPLGACTTVNKDDHSYSYIYQHNVTPPKQVVETVSTRETRNRRYTAQGDYLDQPNEPEIPWPESTSQYGQEDYAAPPRYRAQSYAAPSYVPAYAPSYTPAYVQPSYDPPVVTPYYRSAPVAAASFYSPPPSISLNFRSGYSAPRNDSPYPRTRWHSQPPRTPCGVVNGGYTPPSGRYSPPAGGGISSRYNSGGGRYSFSGRVSFGTRN